MKFEVNLTKKSMLSLFVFLLILSGTLFVFAYNYVPNPGHGANTIVVTAPNGDEMTLQYALDTGVFIPPVPPATGDGLGSRNIIDVSLGGYGGHTCVLYEWQSGGQKENRTSCTGYNGYGQLGTGDYLRRLVFAEQNLVPAEAIDLSSKTLEQFAIYRDGSAHAWGYNGHGQLGTGDTTNVAKSKPVVSDTKTPPTPLTGIKKVAEGRPGSLYEYTCLLMQNGDVRCAGYNGYGQLGDGSTTAKNYFKKIDTISNAIDVEVGGHSSGGYTCAILSDKTVKCWGYNGYGQLGDGTVSYRTSPVTVLGLTNVKQIELSPDDYGSSCAILEDGKVKCWGYNGYGQLGDGTVSYSNTPKDVSKIGSDYAGAQKIKTVGAGSSHSVCAVLTNGEVACWGYNGYGALGIGSADSYRKVPEKTSLSGVVDIEGFGWGGYNSFCALHSSGIVSCWGYNGYGQLGDGTVSYRTSPVPVEIINGGASDKRAKKLFANGYSSSSSMCALLEDQSIKCWGYNGYGQLGTDNTNNVIYPTKPI